MTVYREAKTIYFREGGAQATEETLMAAIDRALELNLGHLVVASSTGRTGLRALKLACAKGYKGKVVVVAQHYGYDEPDVQKMPARVQRQLETEGARVFIGTHSLSGVARSFRLRWQGIEMAEVIAETLRRVSRGIKVCFEVTVMAADAGLIPTTRDVVAVAGSGGGADSAIVVRPANMNNFLNMKVREVIAMPQLAEDEVEREKKGGKRKKK